MLLAYSFKNFLSFKEGVSVSFRLDANVPSSISGGKAWADVMCVKGANASGKTQLLKALAFVSSFASSSFSADPDDEIPVDPFFDSSEPTEFTVEFITNKVQYVYELTVTKERVLEESLYQTKKRKTLVFKRKGNELETTRRLTALTTVKLRPNASVISVANQHNTDLLGEVHRFFTNVISNVNQSGYSRKLDINTVSKVYLEVPALLDFVKIFIRDCDTGIKDITISTEENSAGKKQFFPIFHHEIDGKTVPVFPSTESSGTKHLFVELFSILATLRSGGINIADEFGIYLHPHLIPKLLRLFVSPEINSQGAQLIFSSHDDSVMDFCGRYRTYLVNKEENASYAYRLDEIPGDILRNDRPLSTPYNDGRIGGVPRQ